MYLVFFFRVRLLDWYKYKKSPILLLMKYISEEMLQNWNPKALKPGSKLKEIMINMLKKELAIKLLFLSPIERAENICSLICSVLSAAIPVPKLALEFGWYYCLGFRGADTDPALLCCIQPRRASLAASHTNIGSIPHFIWSRVPEPWRTSGYVHGERTGSCPADARTEAVTDISREGWDLHAAKPSWIIVIKGWPVRGSACWELGN